MTCVHNPFRELLLTKQSGFPSEHILAPPRFWKLSLQILDFEILEIGRVSPSGEGLPGVTGRSGSDESRSQNISLE